MSFNDLPNEVLDIIFKDLICVNGVYKFKVNMKSTPLMLELKEVFNNYFCAEHYTFSNLVRNYSGNKTQQNRSILRDNAADVHNINTSFALYPQVYQPGGSINVAKVCVKCIKKSDNMFSGITGHGHFYRATQLHQYMEFGRPASIYSA